MGRSTFPNTAYAYDQLSFQTGYNSLGPFLFPTQHFSTGASQSGETSILTNSPLKSVTPATAAYHFHQPLLHTPALRRTPRTQSYDHNVTTGDYQCDPVNQSFQRGLTDFCASLGRRVSATALA